MMNKGKILSFFYQIISTNSIEQCMDTRVENLYLDIGA